MTQSQADIKLDGFIAEIEVMQDQILDLQSKISKVAEDDFSDYEDPFEISICNLESVWSLLQSCVSDLEPSDYSVLTIPSKQ
jgi:hypothetical protein